MSRRRDVEQRFRERYALPASDAALAVEREAIGANVGANGYTTIAQADRLASLLELAPGKVVLDIGCGRGWPGVYLAQTTGCSAVLLDMPEPALRSALGRAIDAGVADRAGIVRASAVQPPFASRAFDAITHTDAL